MAEISGYGGAMVFGTAISDTKHNVHSWSLDYKCEALDVTSFADGGDKTFIRGLKEWSASVDAYTDATNGDPVASVGTVAALSLYVNATKYYYGDALCTGFNKATNVDGVETTSYTFQGLSDLAYT